MTLTLPITAVLTGHNQTVNSNLWRWPSQYTAPNVQFHITCDGDAGVTSCSQFHQPKTVERQACTRMKQTLTEKSNFIYQLFFGCLCKECKQSDNNTRYDASKGPVYPASCITFASNLYLSLTVEDAQLLPCNVYRLLANLPHLSNLQSMLGTIIIYFTIGYYYHWAVHKVQQLFYTKIDLPVFSKWILYKTVKRREIKASLLWNSAVKEHSMLWKKKGPNVC